MSITSYESPSADTEQFAFCSRLLGVYFDFIPIFDKQYQLDSIRIKFSSIELKKTTRFSVALIILQINFNSTSLAFLIS